LTFDLECTSARISLSQKKGPGQAQTTYVRRQIVKTWLAFEIVVNVNQIPGLKQMLTLTEQAHEVFSK
jgi:hypothetical protein